MKYGHSRQIRCTPLTRKGKTKRKDLNVCVFLPTFVIVSCVFVCFFQNNSETGNIFKQENIKIYSAISTT